MLDLLFAKAEYIAAVKEFLGPLFVRDRAIRPIQAEYLQKLLWERKPSRVLELGAGYSSLVVDEYLREHPGTIALTSDHHKDWLSFACLYVAQSGLGCDRHYWRLLGDLRTAALASPDEFGDPDLIGYDFIFVDHGPKMWTRVHDLPWITKLLAPGGIIVCDDWFPRGHELDRWQDAMTAGLEAAGLRVRVVEEARDPGCKTLAEAVA